MPHEYQLNGVIVLVTFGFSAYLRLIALNIRPQRTEIKKRLSPRKGGYDFHRSMRAGVRRLIVDQAPLDEVLRSFAQIIKSVEQRSARDALGKMVQWRLDHSGEIYEISSATYESPNGVYKIRFEPDFGITLDGRQTAVHVWNTKSPELTARIARTGLALIPAVYRNLDLPNYDLAVLSLRSSQIFRLGDASDSSSMAQAAAIGIETLFEEVRDELRLPTSRSPDHPAPPPA